jgi:hypothetical protein
MRNDFYARNEAQRNHRFRVGRKRAVSTQVGAVCARRPPRIGHGSSWCSLVARPRSSPVKLLALVSSPCWPRAQLISPLPPPAGAGVYLPRRERAPHHSLPPGPRRRRICRGAGGQKEEGRWPPAPADPRRPARKIHDPSTRHSVESACASASRLGLGAR